MKKQIITIAIVLGLSMTSFAQGGLFHRGANADGTPAESQPAPLGSGIALLTALGAGYVVAKRRREE